MFSQKAQLYRYKIEDGLLKPKSTHNNLNNFGYDHLEIVKNRCFYGKKLMEANRGKPLCVVVFVGKTKEMRFFLGVANYTFGWSHEMIFSKPLQIQLSYEARDFDILLHDVEKRWWMLRIQLLTRHA